MFLVVGLGNPGSQYAHTRHNAGFDVLDIMADKYSIKIQEKKHKALLGQGYVEGRKVIFAKPQTYMNLSGESVQEIISYYKIDPECEMIVIYDDISLDCGNIRIRKKGSAGGHNGIKNIIAMCGTDTFLRIKVGVGEKPRGGDLVNHVLGRLPKAEQEAFLESAEDAVRAAEMLIADDIDRAMNCFNAKKKPQKEEEGQ